MNRLTNLTARVDGGLLASSAYRYDAAGRLDMKTYGNGDQVGASYDIESRLEWLKWTNNGTQFHKTHYVRDVMGNIKTLETNDQAFRYEYDLKDQLKRERLPNGTVNQWDYDEAGNALVMPGLSGAYYYNADDELDGVSSATTTVTGTVTGGVNNHKWYNTWAECRGVRARVSTNNGQFQLPGVPLTYGENILNVTVTDVSGNSSNKSVTVTKGTSGLTKKFYYDAEGNLGTNTASGPWVYVWDYENRLIQATNNGTVVLKCWYDAFGRRVAKWEIVNGVEKKCLYVWDGWELVAVCNGTGALMESYARGVGLAGDIGTLVAIQFTTGDYTNKLFYTHYNHRGDVIMVRDGTTTVAYLDYDPFGRFRGEPATKVSRFLFSSKELDISTGWYYYGYRYYSPTLQRWPSRDPNEDAELLPEGPNLYGYAANNPVNSIDPDGEAVQLLAGAFGVGFSLGLELWKYNWKWHCVDWANVMLDGATSMAGYGLYANVTKFSKIAKAGRTLDKARKKTHLTKYWNNQVSEAHKARRDAAKAAAAAAGAQTAKAIVDCPQKKATDCYEE